MKTKTIGEILRDYREYHKLSLEDLANTSKIKIDYLRALENNQFELLPAATYAKAYIKVYAELFSFDEEPILAILRRDFKQSAKGRLVPREFIKPVLKKRQWLPINLAIGVLLSSFLTLMAYVMFAWYNMQKPPFLRIDEPIEDSTVSAQVLVKGQTINDAVLMVNNQVQDLAQDGSFETQVSLPREGLNTITIESTDRRGKTAVVQRTVRVQY